MTREHYGRSKAKTYVLDDLIVCVLSDGFTAVERTMMSTPTPKEPGHGAIAVDASLAATGLRVHDTTRQNAIAMSWVSRTGLTSRSRANGGCGCSVTCCSSSRRALFHNRSRQH